MAMMMRIRASSKAAMAVLGCAPLPVKNVRALTTSSSGSCSAKADDYLARVTKFMRDHVAPVEDEVTRHA